MKGNPDDPLLTVEWFSFVEPVAAKDLPLQGLRLRE